jgi:hypothetical protein
MCDTWVAMPDSTMEKSVIFAKNSDRSIIDCSPAFPSEEKYSRPTAG